ncbi:MAG: bifunctional homocysteine S-methyltransferase/methylenetetrahydrofolate reductase [Roseburia sp.]|nr:bifunctional homocysteine S-methyltransferase/methylenetetrahydrofolate reductase [Roseburia sp.]
MNATAIREYLQKNRLITDGSFGTYYAEKYGTNEMPELANTDAAKAERVLEIHREYISAGAGLIRTNTFAANTELLCADFDAVEQNITAAVRLARQAAPLFIAGDIGPIPVGADYSDMQDELSKASSAGAEEQYYRIAKTFIKEGIEILSFETFPDLFGILPAIKRIKAEQDVFVMVQFSVNQFGYTAGGLSARRLLAQAAQTAEIDAAGLNCGVGPGHMGQMIASLELPTDKFVIALPNASYPARIRNRIQFAGRPDYFADKVAELADRGQIDIVGGCCGTTPEFIRLLARRIATETPVRERPRVSVSEAVKPARDNAFFAEKPHTPEKLIAVDLAPPFNADDQRLLEAARLLKDFGVDVLTFPDSPSGRTRADSVLMAEKVRREVGIRVMPHICCRDKNAIAIRSTLLGAHINEIYNLLLVTGDPLPYAARQSAKSVFQFDSVRLMNIVQDMNEENFAQAPMCYGGAINQGRRNLDVEIGRVRQKLAAGARFFITQPVFNKEASDRIRRIKEETGARILCGVMPLVNRKNALFMQNELAGINVTEDIVNRYAENASREEGEAVGIALAQEIIALTEDFADGWYFTFPFNRVHMLREIFRFRL